MNREKLIEEAREFCERRMVSTGHKDLLADFALKVLERESIYREICEAADGVKFDGDNQFIFKTPEGYTARRTELGQYHYFTTLIDAYQWVKGETKDDKCGVPVYLHGTLTACCLSRNLR